MTDTASKSGREGKQQPIAERILTLKLEYAVQLQDELRQRAEFAEESASRWRSLALAPWWMKLLGLRIPRD